LAFLCSSTWSSGA